VSHDTTNAGFDPLAAPPREGEGIVKWPILAQLPWVGESDSLEEPAASPADILPFGQSAPQPFAPTPFESDVVAPQLRIVDPALPAGEEFVAVEPLNRRLDRPTTAARTLADGSRLNLHRLPPDLSPATPSAADFETSRPAISAANPQRQYRRIDPPQPLTGEGVALHHPHESFAAQLYQWHAARKPRTALIAMSLLLLGAGGLYLFTTGRRAPEPREAAAPPLWEVQPLAPAHSLPNATLAAPLPPNPTLDLSTGAPTIPVAPPATNDSQPPITNKSSDEADDPIAAWLNQQPQLPQLTASKDGTEYPAPAPPPAETSANSSAEPPVEPAIPVEAATRQSDPPITPTPVLPSLTSTSPYPTTPYPPFPASLALPLTNAWPPAVAETVGPAFAPPQSPR
jgi:hypothetical protein